jgi:signal recognition particle receptor subunit beta
LVVAGTEDDPSLAIRVVYDGPPHAGKTTSLRALAREFGRKVFTPEEQDGRTVYFDWLEHTGGSFNGAPLRFRVVSVPGQQRWSDRRFFLLATADVVVFVGDSRRASWPLTLARLHELCAWLEARPGPPIGVVFQANHRDAPDAVAAEEVREELRSQRVAVVESVALDGSGVREAFVLAVRLALDRLRSAPELATEREDAGLRGGERLRERLMELSGPSREDGSDLLVASAPESLPWVPHVALPSEFVWPPVEGRILLRDAIAGSPEVQQAASGEFSASSSPGFRVSSPAEASFQDLQDAQSALAAWSLRHRQAEGLLSKGRCLALTGASSGGFRLWQLVRREPSLRELFVDGCESMPPRLAARQLAAASRVLTEARARRRASGAVLSCTLDSVGSSDLGEPIYVADVPFLGSSEREPPPEAVALELAERFRDHSADERSAVNDALRALQRRDPSFAPDAHIGDLLSQLLSS